MNDSVRTFTKEIAHSEQLLSEGKFAESLQLVETIEARKNLTPINQLTCHLLRSTLLHKMGHYKDALEIAERVKGEGLKLNAHLHIVDSHIFISEILWFFGRFDESLDVVEQGEIALNAIPPDQSTELLKRRATLINRRGSSYVRQGNLSLGLDCFERSLTLFIEIDFKQGKAESLYSIGTIRWRNGDLDGALEYFEQSLALREEIGSKFDIASSLNAVGIIHRMKGDLNQALEYYKRSLVLKEEMVTPKLLP